MSVGNINQGLNGLNSPLSYMGVNASQPSQFRTQSFDPGPNDSKNFALGAWWLNTSTLALWYLASLVGNTATWLRVTLNGASFFQGNSGGIVTPDAAGLLHVVGDGITVNVVGNPGTNTLTISAVGSGTVETLTGNSGGAVSPAAGNINVVGDGNSATVVGNPGTNTLTISSTNFFVADVGSAVPSGLAMLFAGSHGINTDGTGATITTAINNTVTLGDLSNVAVGSPSLTLTTGDLVMGGIFGDATHSYKLKFPSNGGFTNDVFFYLNNIFMGQGAGNLTMTPGVAIFNIGIGSFACDNLTTGAQNTAIGNDSLTACTTGDNNIAHGYTALSQLTTGSRNLGIGSGAGGGIKTGNDNILIGNTSGSGYNAAESGNILIGTSTGVTGESNVTRISGIRGTTTNVNDAIAVLIDSTGQLGTVSSSIRFKENVNDMASYSDDLMSLRPVVFNYKNNTTKDKSFGLIAEEVETIMPDLVVYDKEGLPQTVKYHDLVPMLLNEVQKLHRRVKSLEHTVANI